METTLMLSLPFLAFPSIDRKNRVRRVKETSTLCAKLVPATGSMLEKSPSLGSSANGIV